MNLTAHPPVLEIPIRTAPAVPVAAAGAVAVEDRDLYDATGSPLPSSPPPPPCAGTAPSVAWAATLSACDAGHHCQWRLGASRCQWQWRRRTVRAAAAGARRCPNARQWPPRAWLSRCKRTTAIAIGSLYAALMDWFVRWGRELELCFALFVLRTLKHCCIVLSLRLGSVAASTRATSSTWATSRRTPLPMTSCTGWWAVWAAASVMTRLGRSVTSIAPCGGQWQW